MLNRLGMVVRMEHMHADIVCYDPASRKTITIEVEISPGNIRRNVVRNTRQGADVLVVISNHERRFALATKTCGNAVLIETDGWQAGLRNLVAALRTGEGANPSPAYSEKGDEKPER